MHAVQRIDPSPEALQDAVRVAPCAATPDGWDKLLAPDWPALEEKGTSREGQAVRRFHLGTGLALDLRAVWWSDAIGRKHWRIAAEVTPPDRDPSPAFAHPITAFAPPLSCIRRGDGIVVHCRCGMLGTPAALGWMGRSCGPCHDREQEGLPPLGPPAGHVALRSRHPCLVLPGGRVAIIRVKRAAGPDLALGVWASPDAAAPEWEIPCGPSAALLVSGGGLIALADGHGGVLIVSSLDGKETARVQAREAECAFPRSACFVGEPARAFVLASTDGLIGHYPLSATGELGVEVVLAVGGIIPRAGVSVVAVGDDFLTIEENAWWGGIPRRSLRRREATLVDVLGVPDGESGFDPAVLPDGSVVAVVRVAEGWRLARWASAPWYAAARTWWRQTEYPRDCRMPERLVPTGTCSAGPVLAADGEIALVEDGEIVARCAKTLGRRASIRPEGVELTGHLAF